MHFKNALYCFIMIRLKQAYLNSLDSFSYQNHYQEEWLLLYDVTQVLYGLLLEFWLPRTIFTIFVESIELPEAFYYYKICHLSKYEFTENKSQLNLFSCWKMWYNFSGELATKKQHQSEQADLSQFYNEKRSI